jgi:DNA-binding CsgD family transcriptional regulator
MRKASGPVISTKELSALLATLYAAPLEPGNWQVFLDQLCSLTDISSGYLVGSHPSQGNLVLAGGGLNFDPEVFRLYNEHYGASDPYRDPLLANPRVGLIQGEDLVPHTALLESELYNEVLSRYDLEYMNMLSCKCTTDSAELLSLWRSPKHGPLNKEAIHLLETLLPHIQTALHLRTRVAASDTSNLFSETTLDAMSIAAFLVTREGRIRHRNQRAAAYLQHPDLQHPDGLSLRHGRLTISNSLESAQLQRLIAGATSSSRDGAPPGGAMKVSRNHAQPPLQIAVIPVPEHNPIAGDEPCALVFVSDPSSSPRPRAAIMRQLYRLSPTESRLADLLMEGFEVREAAELLSITLETCRFHLKRVLAKTGTSRQTELLRLMLSLPGQ